jgi:hypothetical protein
VEERDVARVAAVDNRHLLGLEIGDVPARLIGGDHGEFDQRRARAEGRQVGRSLCESG